jgi:putative DNA primase/helicase
MIHPANSLRQHARGQWFVILTMLGLDSQYLRNRHGPCPVCGGTDRFRWDDRNGDGTFYCNQCGAGSGFDLVMRTHACSFSQAARLVNQVIGTHPSSFPGRNPSLSHPERSQASIRSALNALWRGANPIRTGDPVDLWLRNRGISLPAPPMNLHAATRLRHAGPPVSFHPAMLARVTDPSGRPVTIHRTWLTAAGTKAPVNPVRMFCPGTVPPGSAVRLAPAAPLLGVAEGIETALAAQLLFGFPVWACLSAARLSTFEPIADTQRLVVCADNDASATGQRAAYTLASRLSTHLTIEIRIPDQPDTDWNDVLRQRQNLPAPPPT